MPRGSFRVGVPVSERWDEVLNSDATIYGGSGWGNLGGVTTEEQPMHGRPASINIVLPPLSISFFRMVPRPTPDPEEEVVSISEQIAAASLIDTDPAGVPVIEARGDTAMTDVGAHTAPRRAGDHRRSRDPRTRRPGVADAAAVLAPAVSAPEPGAPAAIALPDPPADASAASTDRARLDERDARPQRRGIGGRSDPPRKRPSSPAPSPPATPAKPEDDSPYR